VTIPDGTQLPPRTPFVKVWAVRNSGLVPWPEGCQLVFTGGDSVLHTSVRAVDLENRFSKLEPGSECEVSVPMLAPELPGRYVTYWRMSRSDEGSPKLFGHRIWCEIFVKQDEPDATAPSDQRLLFRPNPGNLKDFESRVGESFVFEVTGNDEGSIWGGNVLYTADSQLSTAAVHAGLLRPGEKGLVRATVRPGQAKFIGSAANGITSVGWGTYPGSYELSKVAGAPIVAPPTPEQEMGEFEQEVSESDQEMEDVPVPDPTVHSPPVAPLIDIFASPVVREPAPEPVPTPPAPVPVVSQYESQLTLLDAMGFSDREVNDVLLTSYNGDMVKTVQELLQNAQK